jgi:predicted component of type VI protein secretion system
LESTAAWKASATRDEGSVGDQFDLLFNKNEDFQPRRLHKEIQPIERLDKAIEEIRRLMVNLEKETISREKMNIRRLAQEAGMQQ